VTLTAPTSMKPPPRTRGRRILVIALFTAAAVAFLCFWLPAARGYYDLPQPLQTGASAPQFDLFQYYASGHNWRLGLDPYATLLGVAGALAVPRSAQVSGFIYPPVFLPLFGELSRLAYSTARAAWLTLSLAMLVVPLLIGAALAPGRRLETLGAGLLLISVSNPVLFHIRQGQIDMIVAGLAITACLLCDRARAWPASLLFGIAIAIKLTPLVLLLSLVAYRRDWNLLLKTALVCACLVLGSLVLVHPQLYVEFFTKVLPEASEGNPYFHNQSLLRAWSHLGAFARYASLAGFALVIAAAAASGPRRSDTHHRISLRGDHGALRSRDTQVLALAVLGQLLFAPLSWRMAFVWVVVPMALVLAAAPWEGRRWHYVTVLTGTVLMCMPLWDHPVLDSLETIGAVVAGAGLLAALLTSRGSLLESDLASEAVTRPEIGPGLSRWRPARSRRAAGP
jgi:hypothetical protein